MTSEMTLGIIKDTYFFFMEAIELLKEIWNDMQELKRALAVYQPPSKNLLNDKWLRTDQVVQVLGINTRSVYRLFREDIIPHTKVGGIIYVKASDLELILKEHLILKKMEPRYRMTERINEFNVAPSLYPLEEVRKLPPQGSMKFSFFQRPVQNTIPFKTIGLSELKNLMSSDGYQINTEILRSLSDPVVKRNYKARNFDYCCFSGIFSKRAEMGLIQHSGLLTIDFDHIHGAKLLKEKLINDENFETVVCFISPSGDGVKWIIKIDLNRCSHLNWFLAVQNYIDCRYHLKIDKSGKDVSRCCFLPYDPEVYVNKKYISSK